MPTQKQRRGRDGAAEHNDAGSPASEPPPSSMVVIGHREHRGAEPRLAGGGNSRCKAGTPGVKEA
jgi:hypothetical protein